MSFLKKFALLAMSVTFASAESRPNLFFVLADDCTFRDLELYGGVAKTPHLNKIAAEGMKFNRCYQAAPICSPTRHNLYTGIYPVKSGAYPNHTFVYPHIKTLPTYLLEQGYRVALFGKTHIGPRKSFPFEYFPKGFGFYGKDKEGRIETKPYANPRYPEMESFIKECVESDTPFCIIAASHEPHGPYTTGDASVYQNHDYPLPVNLVDTPKTRSTYAKYLAEVTFFDGQVGECSAMLERHEVTDNTLLMVATEQGSGFPFGKFTTYENGVGSGLVARWPAKIAKGVVSEAIVEYVDVVPTFLEVAGAPIPEVLEGRSFLPVLEGETVEHKDYAYSLQTTVGVKGYREPYGTRSVVSERYRYIRNVNHEGVFTINGAQQISQGKKATGFIGEWQELAKSGDENAKQLVETYYKRPEEELYDIKSDPYCRVNLADHAENADVLKNLSSKLDAWMEQQGDTGAQTELDAAQRSTMLLKKANKKTKKNP